MQLVVPVGPNTATVQVLDPTGSDITGSCTITAVSSDPTVIQVGNPDAATPNIIPFTALVPASTADVTYTATNSAGQVVQTDNLSVEVTAPTSMVITYGTTVPSTAMHKK